MYLKPWAAAALMTIMTLLLTYPAAGAELFAAPALTISGSYDSNPFSRGADQAVQEDYVWTLSPRLGVTRQGLSHAVSASYRADAIFYGNEPDYNYVAHTADLGLDVEASKRTGLAVHDSLAYTKDSLTAFGPGIQTERTDILRNTLALSADHELKSGTTLRLALSDSVTRFGDDALVDTRTDSAEAGATKRFATEGTAGARYIYTHYAFDEAGGSSSIETHEVRAELTSEVARDLTATLSAGAVYTAGGSGDLDYTAGAELKKGFRDTTATLGYSRGVSSAQGLSSDITTNERWYMALRHDLSGSVGVSLSGDARRARSEPARTVDLISYSANASADWRVYSWLSASFAYSRFVQWSDLGLANDVKKDRAGITLTFTPEQWRL